MKIGIFGGSFNPPHNGHINSVITVAKKTGLKQVRIIPTSQNPLKTPTEGPSAAQRLKMTQLAVDSYGDLFVVDDIEIKKGGVSYTIDTILELKKTHPNDDLHLIIGLDNFENFGSWKKAEEILKECNLIVTSRPGFDLPSSVEELPEIFRKNTAEFDFNFIELNSGKSVQFISLDDVEISASELRKWLRVGKSTEKYLPLAVENYIKENGIYKPIGDKVGDYSKFMEFAAQELYKNKALQLRAFDLRELSTPSEFSIVTSGTSTKHTMGLAEMLMKAIKEEYNVYPLSLEGIKEGRWILLDYGSMIVHIFYDYVREEYKIENLWRSGKEIVIKDNDLKK